jgi:hypothetical protein
VGKPEHIVAFAVLVAGCGGPRLRPAPGAETVPDRKAMARAEIDGVFAWVDGDAWRGYPRDLGEVVTPLWVHLENRSDRRVRVAYESFALQAGSFRRQALSPFAMGPPGEQGANTERRRVAHPRFYSHRYRVASPYRDFYGPQVGLDWWDDPWPYDEPYYNAYYDWTADLPTRDMLQKALPEGVLEPGGGVSGFVYFQSVRGTDRVRFELEVLDAETGEAVGQVAIPFVSK